MITRSKFVPLIAVFTGSFSWAQDLPKVNTDKLYIILAGSQYCESFMRENGEMVVADNFSKLGEFSRNEIVRMTDKQPDKKTLSKRVKALISRDDGTFCHTLAKQMNYYEEEQALPSDWKDEHTKQMNEQFVQLQGLVLDEYTTLGNIFGMKINDQLIFTVNYYINTDQDQWEWVEDVDTFLKKDTMAFCKEFVPALDNITNLSTAVVKYNYIFEDGYRDQFDVPCP